MRVLRVRIRVRVRVSVSTWTRPVGGAAVSLLPTTSGV